MWKQVFGREDFGIDDDFFELGGNSLMAMRIYMKLSEEVDGLEIYDFFECFVVFSRGIFQREENGTNQNG